MYTDIFLFIVAFSVFSLYMPQQQATFSALLILPACLLGIAALYLCCRAAFNRIAERGEQPGSASSSAAQHGALLARCKFAALGLFSLFVLVFELKQAVPPLLHRSELLLNLYGIAVFVLLLLSVWCAAYPAYRRCCDPHAGLPEYLMWHIRLSGTLILPWLAFSALLDGVALIPGGTYAYVRSNLLVFGLLLAGCVVCIGIFFPWIIVRLWGCSPLPDGPVRRDIQKVCAKAGVRCSDIYAWNLFGGTLLSAGVMGFVPAFRYLLISPALLDLLDRAELEAVIAHEAAHMRHKHMLFYLVFILGYGFVSAVFYRYFFGVLLTSDLFLALALRSDGTFGLFYHCIMIGSAITLLLLYFRVLFGVISRAFERQADCAALSLTGSVAGIIGALEKISAEGTHSRSAPSWHHHSIAARIEYLRDCERMPQRIMRHSRRVRMMTVGYCVVLAVLAALVWGNRAVLSEYDAGNTLIFMEKLTVRLPNNAGLRFQLAGLYYEKNLFSAAEKEYRRAIELRPDFYDAYNNLAWIYATCEDPAVRDYPESLRLARIAVSLAPYSYILDTLAESLYVNGLYYLAVIASEEALGAAQSENRSYYEGQLEKFRAARDRNADWPHYSGDKIAL